MSRTDERRPAAAQQGGRLSRPAEEVRTQSFIRRYLELPAYERGKAEEEYAAYGRAQRIQVDRTR